MRYLKIFLIGFFVIFIIQLCVLVFLEKIYLVDNVSYSSKLIENTDSNISSKPKLTIENGATKIAVSFDGSYLAYIKNNNLDILDLENGKLNKISSNVGMKISYYKWIYDRNRLIIAEKHTDINNGTYFRLFYYDINNKTKTEIFNEDNNKSIKIPIYSANEEVNAIEMSTLTNVLYIKTSDFNNYCRIYRVNIMAQENNLYPLTNNIGRITSTKMDDNLLYEDLYNKMVYKYGNSIPVTIEGHSNLRLLGIDDKDNVYLALEYNNKTQQIYYGNISNSRWKKLKLENLANINDIFINLNGQILVNDASKSTIKDLSTGKVLNYKGNIVGIYNNGAISIENNEIIKNSF